MIDEFIELKKLKKLFDEIYYLFYEKITDLPLVINKEKTIKKIKELLKQYHDSVYE